MGVSSLPLSRYDEADSVDFPQYLRAIASYFTKLRLDMSLTCEVSGRS